MIIGELKPGTHSYQHIRQQGNLYTVAEIQVGRGGQPPPPPTFRKSAQFVGNFRLCRNFKTIEYTEIDRKNYWRVRQLISIERRFDYLETICLIGCVNNKSY